MQPTSRVTLTGKSSPVSYLDEAVAAAIRTCRIDANLTQRQVAARLPWDVSVYIKSDAGRRRITIPQVILIAHALERIATMIRCYRIVTRLSLQNLAERSERLASLLMV